MHLPLLVFCLVGLTCLPLCLSSPSLYTSPFCINKITHTHTRLYNHTVELEEESTWRNLPSECQILQMKKRSRLETKKTPKCESKAKEVKSDDPEKAGCSRRRTNIDSLYRESDDKKSVMDRAEEVLQSIPAEYPSFTKHMLPSNVYYSFWLILPVKFCKTYMPKEDARILLVDDSGEETQTTYLVRRHGLSAGWRGFAVDHRLLQGDILVFHMFSPCKFKVNIVRVYDLDVADAALMLMIYTDDVAKLKRQMRLGDQPESRPDDSDAEVPEDDSGLTEYGQSNELS